MRRSAIAAAALLTSVAMPAQAASLIGSTATASLLYPGSTVYAGPVSRTVGAGVEFGPGTFAPAAGSIDIGANTLTFFTNQTATYSTASFNGYSIDFSGRKLTSVTLGGSSSFAPAFTFNGGNLSFNVSGLSVNAGDSVVFNIAAAVPEPASWAMMIAGFGLAGAALRRRRQATVVFA